MKESNPHSGVTGSASYRWTNPANGREMDLNHRPPAYGAGKLPLLYPGITTHIDIGNIIQSVKENYYLSNPASFFFAPITQRRSISASVNSLTAPSNSGFGLICTASRSAYRTNVTFFRVTWKIASGDWYRPGLSPCLARAYRSAYCCLTFGVPSCRWYCATPFDNRYFAATGFLWSPSRAVPRGTGTRWPDALEPFFLPPISIAAR